MREPDPMLLARAAAGDPACFEDLICVFQHPLWRFLTHLLGDEHLAEDATQETFLRVHRALPGFEGRSQFSTWLFGIARNVGLDSLRRQRRRPHVVGPITADPAANTTLGVSVEIAEALASLPLIQREALLIIEVLGLSYREAAEMTGVAEGTFKSRVYHARQHLHMWLRHEERAHEV